MILGINAIKKVPVFAKVETVETVRNPQPKTINRVVNAIPLDGEIARADLVRLSGISKNAMTYILKALEGDGIIKRRREGSYTFIRLNK